MVKIQTLGFVIIFDNMQDSYLYTKIVHLHCGCIFFPPFCPQKCKDITSDWAISDSFHTFCNFLPTNQCNTRHCKFPHANSVVE
jgi:hypothetical protein